MSGSVERLELELKRDRAALEEAKSHPHFPWVNDVVSRVFVDDGFHNHVVLLAPDISQHDKNVVNGIFKYKVITLPTYAFHLSLLISF